MLRTYRRLKIWRSLAIFRTVTVTSRNARGNRPTFVKCKHKSKMMRCQLSLYLCKGALGSLATSTTTTTTTLPSFRSLHARWHFSIACDPVTFLCPCVPCVVKAIFVRSAAVKKRVWKLFIAWGTWGTTRVSWAMRHYLHYYFFNRFLVLFLLFLFPSTSFLM